MITIESKTEKKQWSNVQNWWKKDAKMLKAPTIAIAKFEER